MVEHVVAAVRLDEAEVHALRLPPDGVVPHHIESSPLIPSRSPECPLGGVECQLQLRLADAVIQYESSIVGAEEGRQGRRQRDCPVIMPPLIEATREVEAAAAYSSSASPDNDECEDEDYDTSEGDEANPTAVVAFPTVNAEVSSPSNIITSSSASLTASTSAPVALQKNEHDTHSSTGWE